MSLFATIKTEKNTSDNNVGVGVTETSYSTNSVIKPQAVTEIKPPIDISDDYIDKLGSNKNGNNVSKEVLSRTKASQLDEVSNDITTVIKKVNSFDMKGVTGAKGAFGWFKNIFADAKEEFFKEFNTIEQQIDRFMVGLNKNAEQLKEDIVVYKRLRKENEQRYIHLQKEVADGKEKLRILTDYLNSIDTSELPPLEMQKYGDLKRKSERLNKNIYNSELIMASILQQDPMIVEEENSTRAILESYEQINNFVIDLWRNQFVMHVASIRKQKANENINAVNDMTNKLMRENAQLVGKNMVESARTAQRAVIEIETLEQVQKDFTAALAQRAEVVNEAIRKRGENEARLKTINEQSLKNMM